MSNPVGNLSVASLHVIAIIIIMPIIMIQQLYSWITGSEPWEGYIKIELVIPFTDKNLYPEGIGQTLENEKFRLIKDDFQTNLRSLIEQHEIDPFGSIHCIFESYDYFENHGRASVVTLYIKEEKYKKLSQAGINQDALQSTLYKTVYKLMQWRKPDLIRQYTSQ